MTAYVLRTLSIFSVYLCHILGESTTDNAYLLGTLECVIGSNRDSEQVLVRVDERVGDRHQGGVVQGQGDGSNGLDTRQEAVEELLLRDVKDGRGEDVAVIEDLDNTHTVGERRDVEQVQERSLGGTNTSTGGDDLDVGNDFNRTTSDLSGDTEGLEEGGLARLHTGVASRNGDVQRREGTSTGGGGDLVGGDEVTDLLEVAGGEDESNVALDVGKEPLELGVLGEDSTESTADHGVLAHHHDTLATKGNTNLMHLV